MYLSKIHISDIKELSVSSAFLNINWLKSYDHDKLTPIGIFNNNNELIGSFFLYNYKRLKFFKQLSAPPFMPTCELTYKNLATNNANKQKFDKEVLIAIADYLGTRREIMIVDFPSSVKNITPFIHKNFKVSTRITYQLDLLQSEEELFSNMSSERRKNIKKAIKDGVTFEKVKNTNSIAVDLIKSTYDRNNKTVDYTIIENILKNMTEDSSYMHIAFDHNKHPVAANFCVFDDNKTTYKFGGYSSEFKHEGAGALLMWESIKLAKSKGIEHFDFDGSMLPAIETFFRGFGGEIVNYHTIAKAPILLEYILKTRQRGLF